MSCNALYDLTSVSLHKSFLTPYFLYLLLYHCSTLVDETPQNISLSLHLYFLISHSNIFVPKWFPYLRCNWNSPWQDIIARLANLADAFQFWFYLHSHQIQWITAPFLKYYLTLTSTTTLHPGFPYTSLRCSLSISSPNSSFLAWGLEESQGSFQGPLLFLTNIFTPRWFNPYPPP